MRRGIEDGGKVRSEGEVKRRLVGSRGREAVP